jgi:hypothetical protein
MHVALGSNSMGGWKVEKCASYREVKRGELGGGGIKDREVITYDSKNCKPEYFTARKYRKEARYHIHGCTVKRPYSDTLFSENSVFL